MPTRSLPLPKARPAPCLPIFQYRFGNGLQKPEFSQARGLPGRSYLSTIETPWRRAAEYYAVPWRGKWATELGGCCLARRSMPTTSCRSSTDR